MGTVLVVEDQKAMRSTMAAMLRGAGHVVSECATSAEALSLHTMTPFELVLTDLRLDGGDGLGLLRRLRAMQAPPEVIVVTAYSTIESAVEAMKTGAFDYLPKPFSPGELAVRVERAIETSRLRRDVVAMAVEFRDRYHFDTVVAKSAPMREVLGLLVRLAPLRQAVLFSGATGSGKEFFAKALHASGQSPLRSLVVFSGFRRADEVVDAELFGSYDARGMRKGLIEELDGGSLLIDEVGDISSASQAKLARYIETGEVISGHDGASRKVNTRIMMSSVSSPEDMLADRSLRSDLYYACSGARIRVPSLEERATDIPDLAEVFVAEAGKRMAKKVRLHERAIEALQRMVLRGNVRELYSIIARAVEEVPDGGMIFGDGFVQDAVAAGAAPGSPVNPPRSPVILPLDRAVDDAEQVAILAALREVDGSRERAADLLGISPTTLWRKMTRLNIVFDSRSRGS